MRRAPISGLVHMVIVLLFAAVAWGCGSDTLSTEELTAEMNKICADNGRAFEEVGHPESFEDIAAMTPQLVDVFEVTLDKIEALHAGDDSGAVEQFVSLGREQRDLMNRMIEVAEDNDAAGFDQVATLMGKIADQSSEIASRIGATECAG